jgi:polyhydroxyalkanoate synthesis regulator protein
MRTTFGGMFPFGRFEEMGKQNLAFFERAMKMFAPFQASERNAENAESSNAATAGDALTELKDQLDTLQKRIDSLSRSKGDKPQK